jgi:hypothetical protein
MQGAPAQPSSWQSAFLVLMPSVRAQVAYAFRNLRSVDREEATQEALAAACRNVCELAQRGKLRVAFATTIARYAVSHVRGGRHVGAAQDRPRDVLSTVGRHRGELQVRSLDQAGGTAADLRGLFIADRKTDIPSLAAFKIDFGEWLRSFTERDQRIITALGDGDRPSAVAERFNVTPGRITQLRRRFEASWRAYQGELPDAAAA